MPRHEGQGVVRLPYTRVNPLTPDHTNRQTEVLKVLNRPRAESAEAQDKRTPGDFPEPPH